MTDTLNRRTVLSLAAALAGASLLAPAARAQENVIIMGKNGWLFPGWESLTDADKPGIEGVIGLIKDARDRLNARNIKLITMVVPLKASFYQDRLPDGTRLTPDVGARYDFVLSQLKAAGVDTVDLRPVLKSVETGRQTAFYRADYHWTAWSAEAAADEVAKVIKAGVRLSGSAGTGDKLGEWVTQRNMGDLAQRFLSPEQQKQVGPDLYTVRTPPEAKKTLLDAAPAPIHVVGNSFVQPYLGFPQRLSNDLDRPVSLTWNPGNVGPWFTFLQYVTSPDFAKQPPQVVVWQFNEGAFHSGPAASAQWDSTSLMQPQVWRDRMAAAIGK